jgi:cytochrome b6-f complex iron-sulfur subunit
VATTRRDILLSGWKLGGAVLVLAAGWTSYEALRPLATKAGGARIQLGNARDFAEGSATYFPEGRLYLVNASGSYFALSQRCPHLGCRVPFCESSGRFECPCHGSIYDLAGEYIKGPSPRGMDRYELSVQGDALVVDTTKTIQGPNRDEQRFLTPPKGPGCLKGS